MSDGSMLIFFQRPLSSPIMVVAVLLFLLPVFQIFWRRWQTRKKAAAAE
jgi:putative tricarboxylic transport membrane protein